MSREEDVAHRLANAASPYLRQHADNPVDWWPWCPEAFEEAARRDVPVLLSVGYAACHWCHVMAHESFESAEVGAWLDEHVVSIKVDREERPDVDTLYMSAVQAFTGGHGGWPMTLVLLPDGRPYLGGTYFPPEPGRGMPSFLQLMGKAVEVYREDRARAEAVAAQVVDHVLRREDLPELRGPASTDWLGAVTDAAAAHFDDTWGGFGGAPKFPPHGTLLALLAHHERTGRDDALTMVVDTLDAMTRGGTYDLLGGGFCRYSVDEAWRIPHFEKMLYDNAQLVPILLRTWQLTGDARWVRVAQETLDYIARDMTGPEGAFYSAEDADSEGVEGLFHAWTPQQLEAVLGDDAARAATLLQVTPAGTFEHGRSVLRLDQPLEDQTPEDRALLGRALVALAAARRERIRPGTDTKRVTAWNALMITAFAAAGSALDDVRYLDHAAVAGRFLLRHLRVEGRLMRVWAEGEAHHLAVLDDHANLLLALLDLYEATFDPSWLPDITDLLARTIDLFWDEDSGTAHYTGRDAPALIGRPRKLLAGPEPSGNGSLALALARLAVLLDRPELGTMADRILQAYAPYAAQAPMALGTEAVAWSWRNQPTREVALVLPSLDVTPVPMLRALHARADSFRVLAGGVDGDLPVAIPWLQGKQSQRGAPTAYVCERGTCQAPVTIPAELEALLARRN